MDTKVAAPTIPIPEEYTKAIKTNSPRCFITTSLSIERIKTMIAEFAIKRATKNQNKFIN